MRNKTMRWMVPLFVFLLAFTVMADDLYVQVKIAGTNGASSTRWVKLEGWTVEPSTNDGYYVASQIDVADVINPLTDEMTIGTSHNPVKEVYVASNSLHVGSESMSEDDLSLVKGVGRSKTLSVTSGDITTDNTDWTLIPGTSVSYSNSVPMKVFASVHAMGKVTSGNTASLTLYVDGANLAGSGGLTSTRETQVGNLGFCVLTDELAANTNHTVAIYGKVSGGTGTVYAAGSTSPIVVSLFTIQGTVD